MNLLLDTHVVLWVFANEPALSVEARAAIRDGRNQVYVSAATAWEISIKKALGKLRAPPSFLEALQRYRFTPLSITMEHALAVEALPHIHHDPFDWMLIAQATVERLTLVTRDRHIAKYEVRLLDA